MLYWRDVEPRVAGSVGGWKRRFGVVKQAAGGAVGTAMKPSAVGWEKNVQGKLGPRMADLAPMMDPTR